MNELAIDLTTLEAQLIRFALYKVIKEKGYAVNQDAVARTLYERFCKLTNVHPSRLTPR